MNNREKFTKGSEVVFTNAQNRSARSWVGIVIATDGNWVEVKDRSTGNTQRFMRDQLRHLEVAA